MTDDFYEQVVDAGEIKAMLSSPFGKKREFVYHDEFGRDLREYDSRGNVIPGKFKPGVVVLEGYGAVNLGLVK